MTDTNTPTIILESLLLFLILSISHVVIRHIENESTETRKLIIEMGNFKTLNHPIGDVAELQMDERYRITNIVFVAGREPKKD